MVLTSRATVDRKWGGDISQDSEAPPGKPQGPLLSGICVDWKAEHSLSSQGYPSATTPGSEPSQGILLKSQKLRESHMCLTSFPAHPLGFPREQPGTEHLGASPLLSSAHQAQGGLFPSPPSTFRPSGALLWQGPSILSGPTVPSSLHLT